MYLVYKLEDPRDGLVYWVGITVNLYKRYMMHLQNSPHTSSHYKLTWIKELRNCDVVPTISVIEKVETKKDALKQEQYWIDHYLSLGMSLTNMLKTGNRQIYTRMKPISEIECPPITGAYVRASYAAQRLGITEKEAIRLLKTNMMPGSLVGRTWHLDPLELEQYIASR